MRLIDFVLYAGMKTDNLDPDLLRRKIVVDNFSRGRLLAFCIVIFDTILIAADLIYWATNPSHIFPFDVYSILYGLMILLGLSILLITRKPIRAEAVSEQWISQMERVMFLLMTFLMTWGSVVSLLDQQLYGEVTVFMVNVVICSVVILMDWRKMLASFAISIAVLAVGLPFYQPNDNVLLGHYINIGIFVVIAWIASRLIYGFYMRDFVNETALTQSNQKLAEEIDINQDINEKLTHANFQLQQLSLIDDLTAISNRRGLRNFITQVFDQTDQPVTRMSALIFDIDHFKQYNDRYGHPAGDQVLVRIAAILANAVSSQMDIAARWGGEEFIFLSFNEQEADIDDLAEKIRRQVELLGIDNEDSPVADHVTISIGTSQMPIKSNKDVSGVIESADIAMYKAKEQGRNQVVNSPAVDGSDFGKVSLLAVDTPALAAKTAKLAARIWREHYPAIIGEEQVEYMIQNFQSKDKIWQDISKDGFEYSLVELSGEPAGYLSLKPDAQEQSMFVSKLYLDKVFRGKGLARKVLQVLIDRCRLEGLKSIWLTVNKHNDKSIAVYGKLGFEVEQSVVKDIGGGYVMDDYVMRLPIE